MLWEDDEPKPALRPADAVEVCFPLVGRVLPSDYCVPLALALTPLLEPDVDPRRTGVRVLHVPTSGNGWYRGRGEVIHVSRRVQLALRVHRDACEEVAGLAGAELNLEGVELKLGAPRVAELVAAEPLYAHRVIGTEGEGEESFLTAAHRRLGEMGVTPRRMLCGREERLETPDGVLTVRSLLIDGMGAEPGLAVQSHGLGEGRHWGCGLFVPHKAVAPV